jgi:hypothetical protein
MKVKKLIEIMQTNYSPEDEIAVSWFDLEHALNSIDSSPTKEEATKAWNAIIDDAQDELDSAIEFTNVGPEIAALLDESLNEEEED